MSFDSAKYTGPVLCNNDWLTGGPTHYINLHIRYSFPLVFVSIEKSDGPARCKLDAEIERFHEWRGIVRGVVLSGSTAEGLQVPGHVWAEAILNADTDRMQLLPNMFYSEEKGAIPMFHQPEPESTADPRYYRLRLTDEYKSIKRPGGEVTEVFLSANAIKQNTLQKMPMAVKATDDTRFNIEGPSINFVDTLRANKNENTFEFVGSSDFVQAFECDWPQEAKEWLTRQRPNKWPSEELISKVVRQNGCHVTPIGKGPYIWRLSFSSTEKQIAHSLSSVQVKTYMLLKMLVKHYLDGILSTYCLKNVLFWMCEKVPKRRWSDGDIIKNIASLIDMLLHSVVCGHLPHYFVIKSNLLCQLSRKHLLTAARGLSKLRKNFPKMLVHLLSNVVFSNLSWSHDQHYGKNFKLFLAKIYDVGLRNNGPFDAGFDKVKSFVDSMSPIICQFVDEFLRFLFVYNSCEDDKKSVAQEKMKVYQMFLITKMVNMACNDYFKMTDDAFILTDRLLYKVTPPDVAVLVLDIMLHTGGRCICTPEGTQILSGMANCFRKISETARHKDNPALRERLLLRSTGYEDAAKNPVCPSFPSMAKMVYDTHKPYQLSMLLTDYEDVFKKFCQEINYALPSSEKPLEQPDMTHLDPLVQSIDKTYTKFFEISHSQFNMKIKGDHDTVKRIKLYYKYKYNS